MVIAICSNYNARKIHIRYVCLIFTLIFILTTTIRGECYDFENGQGSGWFDCSKLFGENNSGYWIWSVDKDNESNHALMANQNISICRKNITGPLIISFEWKRIPGSDLIFRVHGTTVKEIKCDSSRWKSEKYEIDDGDHTIEWRFVRRVPGQSGWVDNVCIPEQVPVEQVPVEQVPVEQVPVEQVPVEQVPVEQLTLSEEPEFSIIETSFYPYGGCLGIGHHYNFSTKIESRGLHDEAPILLQLFDRLSGNWIPNNYSDENYIRYLLDQEQYLNYSIDIDNLFEIPFLGCLKYRLVTLDGQVLLETADGPKIHSLFRNGNCRECNRNRCCTVRITSSIPNMTFYVDYKIIGENTWRSEGPIVYTAYPNPQNLMWELPINAGVYKIRVNAL